MNKKLSLNSFESYIFDVDGTLLDTVDLIHHTLIHVLEPYNLNLSRAEILPLIGIPMFKIFEILIGAKATPEVKESLINQVHQFQKTRITEYVKIFPSVYQGLSDLKKQGKKLGIVTSRINQTLDILLNHFNLTEFFDVVITPAMTKEHKPHPEPLLLAIASLKSSAHNSIYIGDAAVDISCGSAAGSKTALVAWSENDCKKFPIQPDFILNSFEQLSKTLT